jgi:hypothetical protein
MRKIVDGKIYDTEIAERIAERKTGYGRGDFNWCEETLYRTKKGRWFLAGQGGAMTRYAQGSDVYQTSSLDVIPLTQGEAVEWLQEHAPDKLEKYFPHLFTEA